MRRMWRAAVLAGVLVLVAAGAAAGSGTAPAGKAAKAAPTPLTIWVGWSARELSVFKSVVAEYDKKNPNVTVNVVGSINDNKIVAAIRAGTAPDVVSSFNSYNVGIYCGTGGWINLAPLMAQSHISASMFPAATQYYTQYNGVRCALPLLADTYGLYYNKTLFKAAGITSPPKTMSELAADAKKLTVRGSNGAIKVAGIDPIIGFYENVPERWITSFGGKWQDSKGNSILSKDPAWAKWLNWHKSLVDWYGYNNLVRFQAGLGDEFSASNAFEAGKVAMNLDGEWRVAFIQAEHPNLNYAHGADARRRRASGAVRVGLHQRDDHRHPEERQAHRRGMGARQVPDDEHARARGALERHSQRADDRGLRELEGDQAGRALRDVHQDLQQLEVEHVADHRGGRLVHEPGAEVRDAVAGRPGEEPPGRAGHTRQAADAMVAQAKGPGVP